eukprot:1154649-Pelagomonas_calceolata.AAC.2
MEPALAKPLMSTANRRDLAVPLVRNHAPTEVLLRQGAEFGWVPQPDCLKTPSTTVLEGMIGSHIKKFNAGASPRLDGIPIPFLKHVCLPIERVWRVDHVKVLVAALSPLHKKGAMSNPGNYRIIAVSGVMSSLHPLFILRHLKHAAKKLTELGKPRKSLGLHAAFVDFSQAYDTVS